MMVLLLLLLLLLLFLMMFRLVLLLLLLPPLRTRCAVVVFSLSPLLWRARARCRLPPPPPPPLLLAVRDFLLPPLLCSFESGARDVEVVFAAAAVGVVSSRSITSVLLRIMLGRNEAGCCLAVVMCDMCMPALASFVLIFVQTLVGECV
jgi:hypothetical protein